MLLQLINVYKMSVGEIEWWSGWFW